MPLFRQPPKAPTPQEAALAADEAERKLALAADKDPEAAGVEPDNKILVILQDKYPAAPYSHPKMRITEETLHKMNRVEILAVGYDRAYWKKGVSALLKPELISRFLEAQDSHVGLHDAP